MKRIKKLITLGLSAILVFAPMMVSAKVPVSDVGGIVLIGNKGYSMNYLMQTLNETQITEIRQDLNSPSATHLYFKLSDSNAKWIDAFDSSITVDDTELKNQVGNDITVVDVSGRNNVKIIDDGSTPVTPTQTKAPSTFNTSGKHINFYDTTDYLIKSPVQLTKTNYRVQFWKVNSTGNDELLFDTNNTSNKHVDDIIASNILYNVIDTSIDSFRVTYLYATNVIDLYLNMHKDVNMNIVTDLTRYGSKNLYRYALYVNDKLITCEDMTVPDVEIPYTSPEYKVWASKVINYSPIYPY